MLNAIKYKSPFGIITVCANANGDKISRVYLPNQEPDLKERPTELLECAKNQLAEYFTKKRENFNLPLDFENCTEFSKKVYLELLKIKYGETASYKEIAERVNCPKAYRAVGLANNKNLLPIFIPCHRVIGADGNLTGFAGGLELKKKLLELESKK